MNKKAVLTLKIVTAFSAAAVVAGTMTYSYRTADKKKLENNDGLGGLEISAVPQYDTQEKIENSVSENVSDAEFIETDSVQDRKDLLALEEAEKSLELVKNSIRMGMPEDFFSIDLMNAYESLGNIIGESVEEDLVNEIFEKFCMGK